MPIQPEAKYTLFFFHLHKPIKETCVNWVFYHLHLKHPYMIKSSTYLIVSKQKIVSCLLMSIISCFHTYMYPIVFLRKILPILVPIKMSGLPFSKLFMGLFRWLLQPCRYQWTQNTIDCKYVIILYTPKNKQAIYVWNSLILD